MKKKAHITIVLDTRRKLKSGLYPVKLRVYSSSQKKQKLYSTKWEYSESDFKDIWNTLRPKGEKKELQQELREYLEKAEDIAGKLPVFNFDAFEKGMNRRTGDEATLLYHYEDLINKHDGLGKIGTADVYRLSQRSLTRYLMYLEGIPERDNENKVIKENIQKGEDIFKNLRFDSVDKDWLEKYENWMIEINDASVTTVSMYLRALRAVFNEARKPTKQSIQKEVYPFGEDEYEIPSESMTKRALTKEQKDMLLNSEPKTPEQQKAKDFWFLSYYCNGTNFKDIALWKWKYMNDNVIEYLREKTRKTRKKNLKKTRVILRDFSKDVISKYGKEDHKPDDYIFNIIDDTMTPRQKQISIKKFVRFTNQHLKKLAKANGLPEEISTYWARHTFTTIMVHNETPLATVKDLLDHANIQQTMTYVSSLEDEKIKEYLDKL